MLALALPSAAAAARLDVTLEGLRNHRGQVHLCLTADRRHFPDCSGDPRSLRRSFAAGEAAHMSFEVAPGHYVLSVIHDENGNGRLDTRLGIPREGFGFSRNPAIRMGPPRFDRSLFAISGATAQTIRIRYIF